GRAAPQVLHDPRRPQRGRREVPARPRALRQRASPRGSPPVVSRVGGSEPSDFPPRGSATPPPPLCPPPPPPPHTPPHVPPAPAARPAGLSHPIGGARGAPGLGMLAATPSAPAERSPLLYRLLRGGCAPVLRHCFDLSVSGLEHVPATGPFILAANHHNYVDG